MPLPPIPGQPPAPQPAGQNPAASNYNPMSAVPGSRYSAISRGYPTGPMMGGGVKQLAEDPGQLRDARWYQNQVIQGLQRQAAGDPNSQAQQQLRQSFDQARAQQSSLGSTMRGQSAGAAMRSIRAGQQGISRGLAGEEQMLKVQEQQAAQAMLAQLLAQQQGLDITRATNQSRLALGQRGAGDDLSQFYDELAALSDIENAQIEGERQSAEMGFGLERSALTNQLLERLGRAGATGAATLGSMGSSAPAGSKQSEIDNAFNNG